MKDKSLNTLKFTVIFLNLVLIAGFILFVVISIKFVAKSECKDFHYVVDDINNVKISFSGKKMFIIENYGDEVYSTALDNCDGRLINKIKVYENE
ncbi:MAG: hypothetical protein HOM96_02050 [Rickettsiales bacterium]|jgi:hypothetical protein|nr:hypothetical protein [Rickettsiales bacterium]